MADVDIDPFGSTNQGLKSQWMNIFLQPQEAQKGPRSAEKARL